MPHIPVLLEEVLQALDPQPGQRFIDGTINGGGHGLAVLEKIQPGGKLLGIEWDKALYQALKIRLAEAAVRNVILVNDSYANLQKIAEQNGLLGANGILLDLGMSSWHLEESGRGFSFQRDELLDMRYAAASEDFTAADILNKYPEEEIEKILRAYGEEQFSRQIAAAVVKARQQRPLIRTGQLTEVIKNAVPVWYRSGRRLHPATKTFQALRIAVNHESENVEAGLKQSLTVLKPGGRIAVITFHSLEDRLVKNFFRDQAKATNLKILTKHPIRSQYAESKLNPRARSAKLRVAQKL